VCGAFEVSFQPPPSPARRAVLLPRVSGCCAAMEGGAPPPPRGAADLRARMAELRGMVEDGLLEEPQADAAESVQHQVEERY
jgi:hypothetical protein